MRTVLAACLFASAVSLSAQSPASPRFDVVSIKRHTGTELGMNMRTEPDGTTRMTNILIATAFNRVVPVPLRDVVGLPDWVRSERYDIVAKPPDGSARTDRDLQREMWRAMFEDRFKLVFHVEQRERDVYALVLARADGKLGPQLTPSTLDCKSQAPASFNTENPGIEFFQQRCGLGGFGSTIASGGTTIAALAPLIGARVDATVEDHTGLEGLYSFRLTSQASVGPSVDAGASADVPDIFTALQEQLGLKLQRGKKTLPVYVIDHIERPTEN